MSTTKFPATQIPFRMFSLLPLLFFLPVLQTLMELQHLLDPLCISSIRFYLFHQDLFPNHPALIPLPQFQSTDLQYPPWAKIMFGFTAMPSIRHRLAKSNDTFFFIFSSFSSVSFYRRYLCLFTLYHIFPYLSTFIVSVNTRYLY